MVKKWNITIPKLSGDKPRRAYILLPESYEKEKSKHYPVMYMFDGHNVFLMRMPLSANPGAWQSS